MMVTLTGKSMLCPNCPPPPTSGNSGIVPPWIRCKNHKAQAYSGVVLLNKKQYLQWR